MLFKEGKKVIASSEIQSIILADDEILVIKLLERMPEAEIVKLKKTITECFPILKNKIMLLEQTDIQKIKIQ